MQSIITTKLVGSFICRFGIIYWDINGRDWNAQRNCVMLVHTLVKEGESSVLCVQSNWRDSAFENITVFPKYKIWRLRNSEVLHFLLPQTLVRHLASTQSSNFALGKPWYYQLLHQLGETRNCLLLPCMRTTKFVTQLIPIDLTTIT